MNNLPEKPEILAPAGNFEKLKAAFLFGADAVYFSGKNFGMRASAENFTLDETKQACLYAHARQKKLYLTINTVPHAGEIEELKDYLSEIKELGEGPDAVICADIGVVSLVKKTLPGLDIHISTQANVQNHPACLAWAELGAKRVILSRELGCGDIRKIKDNVGDKIELECFVHGSMCVAYSGRCLLSNYLASRDANKGACAQACRWKYHVAEQLRPGQYLPIAEDDRGTYLFSSKDLCMIEHMDDLARCGVDAFKIEGRMKSAYYAACVTNAYRAALDSFYATGQTDNELQKKLKEEINSVAGREFCTGFFYGPPSADAAICNGTQSPRQKSWLGVCVGYDQKNAEAVFEQKNRVELNQKAQILSPSRFGDDILVGNLSDENGSPIEAAARPSMRFKIKIDEDIKRANDIWQRREISPGDMLRSL
ncbi:MAG: U32 family peptidase [Oscillospiraceae bacterium]|nr:U32 family peptidase [Oscillospiraceae bacterium]